MDTIKAKKLSFTVNTIILFFVFFLMGFFFINEATFLVYFSIPTIAVYIINYILIANHKLDIFVWLTNFWIALYMGLTTICLGFEMGFHLYSMSLILVIFVTEYMAYKIRGSNTRATLISVGIALIYIACTGLAIWNGPVYETPKIYSNVMLAINAMIVFTFLIVYSKILLGLVISSEQQLSKMAHSDKLTGLYNRHYLMDVLSESNHTEDSWIALLDIDDFKKINDTYGHNAGDYVLKNLAKILTDEMGKCTVARWGGEEFLIHCNDKTVDEKVVEKLRKEVCKVPFVFEGQEIAVSITAGVSKFDSNRTIDKWIQDADNKLYCGKKNGKNVVVFR